MSARAWTLEEIQLAVRLAYGVRRSGHPNVGPVAEQLGVSERSVQRWLAGSAQPRPERLEQLRAALMPAEGVLRRQEQDVAVARSAVPALRARRAAKATAHWRRESWHKPHLLLVLEREDLGICCPTIRLENRVNPLTRPAVWKVVESVETKTRPEAVLIRAELLNSVGPWRLRVDQCWSDSSSMCWLSTAPRPSLLELATRVRTALD